MSKEEKSNVSLEERIENCKEVLESDIKAIKRGLKIKDKSLIDNLTYVRDGLNQIKKQIGDEE